MALRSSQRSRYFMIVHTQFHAKALYGISLPILASSFR